MSELVKRLQAHIEREWLTRKQAGIAQGLAMIPPAGELETLLADCLAALTAQLAEARRDTGLRDRANNLFGALLEFHNAFHNRGETTSLHEWNERMKRADEHACQILPIPPVDQAMKEPK